jgi:hypothetical protein
MIADWENGMLSTENLELHIVDIMAYLVRVIGSQVWTLFSSLTAHGSSHLETTCKSNESSTSNFLFLVGSSISGTCHSIGCDIIT